MNQKAENRGERTFIWNFLIIFPLAAGTISIVIWILRYSNYGFDFTDDSFYLIWISNPFAYKASITQFGFIYHPLYTLFDGDISALRSVNILLTFGLSWALSSALLDFIEPKMRHNQLIHHSISAAFATSCFTIFGTWLLTPSYNSLAFQGLLLSALGLLHTRKKYHLKSIAGWVTLGVGGWIAFMAKPSTAIALAVVALVYLLISGRMNLRLTILSISVSLVLLFGSALLIDGSAIAFIERMLLGLEFARRLGGGYTLRELLRFDALHLETREKYAALLVVTVVFCAFWGGLSRKTLGLLSSGIICFTLFALTAAVTLSPQTAGNIGTFGNPLTISLFLAALVTSLVFCPTSSFKNFPAEQWALLFLFTVLPHVYAFGTNGNYWLIGSSSSLFWVLAGVVLLSPIARHRTTWLCLAPLAFAAQTITASVLQTGMASPYRQPHPIWLNTAKVSVGANSSLFVSDAYAANIKSAVAIAYGAGFSPGTSIIDLSGQSPGTLYALDAEAIGQAWTIGGYPGSADLALAALNHVPCGKIATAWVLFEPGGPRSIASEIMPRLGAAFPEQYRKAGSWETAKGAGGYSFSRKQELYMPRSSDQTQSACETIRQGER